MRTSHYIHESLSGVSLCKMGFFMFLEWDSAMRNVYLSRRGKDFHSQAPVDGGTSATYGRSTGHTRRWRVVAQIAAYLRGALCTSSAC